MWIHQQRLHLVPLSHTSSIPFPSTTAFSEEEEGFIDSAAAIELVRDTAVDTLAPADLEAIVWDRIKGYVFSSTRGTTDPGQVPRQDC